MGGTDSLDGFEVEGSRTPPWRHLPTAVRRRVARVDAATFELLIVCLIFKRDGVSVWRSRSNRDTITYPTVGALVLINL